MGWGVVVWMILGQGWGPPSVAAEIPALTYRGLEGYPLATNARSLTSYPGLVACLPARDSTEREVFAMLLTPRLFVDSVQRVDVSAPSSIPHIRFPVALAGSTRAGCAWIEQDTVLRMAIASSYTNPQVRILSWTFLDTLEKLFWVALPSGWWTVHVLTRSGQVWLLPVHPEDTLLPPYLSAQIPSSWKVLGWSPTTWTWDTYTAAIFGYDTTSRRFGYAIFDPTLGDYGPIRPGPLESSVGEAWQEVDMVLFSPGTSIWAVSTYLMTFPPQLPDWLRVLKVDTLGNVQATWEYEGFAAIHQPRLIRDPWQDSWGRFFGVMWAWADSIAPGLGPGGDSGFVWTLSVHFPFGGIWAESFLSGWMPVPPRMVPLDFHGIALPFLVGEDLEGNQRDGWAYARAGVDLPTRYILGALMYVGVEEGRSVNAVPARVQVTPGGVEIQVFQDVRGALYDGLGRLRGAWRFGPGYHRLVLLPGVYSLHLAGPSGYLSRKLVVVR